MSLARLWGYDNPALPIWEKKRIASAAGELILYDYGFSKPIVHYSVCRWCKSLATGVESGTLRLLDAAHRGKQGLADKI